MTNEEGQARTRGGVVEALCSWSRSVEGCIRRGPLKGSYGLAATRLPEGYVIAQLTTPFFVLEVHLYRQAKSAAPERWWEEDIQA